LNSKETKIGQDNKQKITNFFVKNGSNLKTVAMVGGEPLLIKENADLLDVIPTNVKIQVISNFSSDVTKSKVFEKLCKRQNM
jgi:organic radical activating enzyme